LASVAAALSSRAAALAWESTRARRGSSTKWRIRAERMRGAAVKRRVEVKVGAKARDKGRCSFCLRREIHGVTTTPPALTDTLRPACVRLPKLVLTATKPDATCSSVTSAATPSEK